jgi:molybdopterin-dependent oxidoreductase alpha subunit
MSNARVSWVPFGVGFTKPHHYLDIARVIWANRDNLRYAWRILRHGVCDGCSLGPYGLRDNTMQGIHLCMTRLRMLRLNTMPALDHARLADVESLWRLSNSALRNLGRLAYPMLRRRGEPGFQRVSWEQALECVAGYLRACPPQRMAFYTTSRGLTNEVYYVVQKVARLLGTNNVDNAARLCHAASTTALKQTIGVAASTCSYSDWIGTDLIVLLGSNIANNQPVAMKYFYYAREKGARFVVINPFREPGLEHYWIPSVASSALFGSRFMDEFYPVRVGGDVAFLHGVLKWLIEQGELDQGFIRDHTRGFEEVQRALGAQSWEELEKSSGLSRDAMRRFAETYARARTAVFIWSMGLTQHRFGVENVKAVVNLALARGMLGRANCGLVPVRGHSGVQGAAEVGSVPNAFPGAFPVSEENARRFSELWGFQAPAQPGLTAAEMLDAAARGDLEVLYMAGGNFLDTLPEPGHARRGLERVRCRVHQDLVLNHSMLLDPGEVVVLLPGQTRYEQPGGGTITSTERRIRFTPEVPRPRLGEEKPEWEIPMLIAERIVGPERRRLIHFEGVRQIIEEMERVMPMYRGIAGLQKEADSVQYGGPMLCEGGKCPTQDGRAVFTPIKLPARDADEMFYLTTRRGQQFNSMIFGDTDSLTGARRDEVFVSPQDAERLGLRGGERIRLRSESGEFVGTCRVADVAPGTLQAHWPEANVLLLNRLDPASKEPDYNVLARLERL